MAIRRTKIVATLGPKSAARSVVEGMMRAGVDVVRHNLSHGSIVEHLERAALVRDAADRVERCVAVMFDLQGPKLRIERFREGKVTLKPGQEFALDTQCPADKGTQQCVGVGYKRLVKEVAPGDTLLLDDGRIIMEVKRVQGSRIICRVTTGGVLEDRKGVNRVGGGLSARALTRQDREHVKAALANPAASPDYFALSFVRDAQDIRAARKLIRAAGGEADIVAKIERHEALDNIDEIISEADAVMIARGDLGIEIGDSRLPGMQKMLIQKARTMNRVTITATQMMESMIKSPVPTRAEVFDVANAVLDGTDAVMLSAETAAGNYPVEVVQRMHDICYGAERERAARVSHHRIEQQFEPGEETIAMAAMYAANHSTIKAILALTDTGATTRLMSRISSGIPIYAMTPYPETARRVTLYRGVYPVLFSTRSQNHVTVVRQAIQRLRAAKLVHKGDDVLLTKGEKMGVTGGTNMLQIVRVE